MNLKYRHSPYDFSTDALPISIGQLDRILKNNNVEVGSLYEILVALLYNAPGFRAGKFWFTLVNVTCTHSGFSFGILPPPPEQCRPLAGTWHYTFALSSSGYTYSTVPKHVSLRGINMIAWGTRRGNEFLTISTTHYQAEQLGIRYDQLTPQFLYYLLGTMTKNFAVRNRFRTVDEDYSDLHNHNLSMFRGQYYMMPLYNLMRNVPYHLWVFNRHMWMNAPILLSPRHMTANALMYLCLNIRQVKKLPKEAEDVLVDKFHESLTDFVQRQANSEHAKEVWQLLYAALCLRSKIPTGVDPVEWIGRQESTLEVPTGNYSTLILNMLYS